MYFIAFVVSIVSCGVYVGGVFVSIQHMGYYKIHILTWLFLRGMSWLWAAVHTLYHLEMGLSF